MREWRAAQAKGKLSTNMRRSRHRRLERLMHATVVRKMDALEGRMGFLASVGSVSPFVGLFGTVWGIMNSFWAIAVAKNTHLTVVAPAIAEALFATALGLVAAIPAVMAYNKISGDLSHYGNRLDSLVEEVSSFIARQLEEEP